MTYFISDQHSTIVDSLELLDANEADMFRPINWTALQLLLILGAPGFCQEQLRIKATTKGRSNWVDCVVFSPDGRVLASGGGGFRKIAELKLWNARSGELIASLITEDVKTLRGDSVASVSFSPDGSLLATGQWNSSVRLWDVRSRKLHKRLAGHSDRVMSVSFSPDGRWLASAGWDGVVKIWNVASGDCRQTLDCRSRSVHSVAFSPIADTVACGTREGDVLLWDSKSGKQIAKFSRHTSTVNAVAFSPDGKLLASGSEDTTVRIWDVATRKERKEIDAEFETVTGVSFSPDGHTLAYCGGRPSRSSSMLKLWNVATGKEIGELKGHSDAVKAVAFSSDGRLLASAGFDSTVRTWNVPNQSSAVPGRMVVLNRTDSEVCLLNWSWIDRPSKRVMDQDRFFVRVKPNRFGLPAHNKRYLDCVYFSATLTKPDLKTELRDLKLEFRGPRYRGKYVWLIYEIVPKSRVPQQVAVLNKTGTHLVVVGGAFNAPGAKSKTVCRDVMGICLNGETTVLEHKGKPFACELFDGVLSRSAKVEDSGFVLNFLRSENVRSSSGRTTQRLLYYISRKDGYPRPVTLLDAIEKRK